MPPLPSTHGAKHDADKPRWWLVTSGFADALREVVKVGTFGAEKYTDHGWLEVPDAEERYRSALLRHLMASDEIDDESGLLHLAHAAWNALAILQLHLRRTSVQCGTREGTE